MIRSRILGVLAGVLLVTSSALAAPSTLKDSVRLGEHWYGPEFKLEDLKGRVVLFEIWGMN